MKQWNHHQKGQGNDKHDYGAAKQISGISGSFVSLFTSKHGTLDEHSKTTAVNAGLITTCWAPFNQLSLSARSPQCKTRIHIPVQQAPLRAVFVQEILDMSGSVWQHVILGNTSPVTCFASHFCRFAMVISTYFNFRAKGAFGDFGVHPIVWRCATQHHGVQRVWIKLGSPQSWAALDVNPKTKNYIPRMMNICGCMWLLFLPVWDPDWAWQVVGISAVQPLVV